MILTEDEAKTKACPEIIKAVYTHTIAYGAMGQAFSAPAGPPLPVMEHCLGSACMAWRWYRPDDLTPADGSHTQSYSVPRGYCGKAGKP